VGQTAPPPDASVVFTNAARDQTAGKLDPAIQEFQDFIKFYPDNPNAARAQYNIGEIHYTQQKYELAAQDFDTVITHYPEDAALTPRAYFLKGMALKDTNKLAAQAAWRAVVTKYPHSDEAAQAKERLRASGATVAAPAPGKKKVTH
jgi:TolA-binding protein